MGVLKQLQMAAKGSKSGKPLSNCGKKMAIAFLTVHSLKTSI